MILERLLFSYVQELDPPAARSEYLIAKSTGEEADIDTTVFEIQKHISQSADLMMQYSQRLYLQKWLI